jgi:predicted aconitase with swiveling domain
MKKIILHCRKIVGGSAEGEALVTSQAVSGWGGIDPMHGTIIERRHELRGQSFRDKIFVIPGAKGSSGGSMGFHRARLAGNTPKAFIFNEMSSKMAIVAIVTHAPAVTGLDQNPLDIIKTGDWVKVDADRGIVEVLKRDAGDPPVT